MINQIKILYVEDEISIQQFMKIIFKKNSVDNVVFALNGKEALELYKNNSFDLVITDMIMPIMDGFELIEEIKKINSEQVFMMVTGLDSKEDLIRAIELRVNYFIEKPVKPKKFKQVLEEATILVNQKKELALSNLILSQYKHAIDESTILSKTDIDGKLTYVNKEFCKISKFTEEELIGKNHNIVRHPDMSSDFFKNIWKTIKAKKQWRGIVKNRAKDGTDYIVDALITPFLDMDGNIIEFIAIRHDITKLEQYKNNLQAELDLAVKDIVDTQKEVVFTMGAIGESRSKETGLHVKRVADYSYTLAILHGCSEDEAELLKLASPMHDIGKVGISDDILNKPGRLTYEEFEVMKTHSLLGYEMLKNSKREILKTSAIVAYEHHERWDGKGYPRGLKEDEIHIYGRITALCDVFDALGSYRVYKEAWSLEKILDLFKEERGKQFDPDLIDLFLNNLDKFLKIRDENKDTMSFRE
jgi:PAS domain S-box-containing protein